jgi:hypothetical protein
MKTAQIGAAGVLLIQYHLMRIGIDSAPMTTDDGIDLVAYAPGEQKAITIQVKTCLQPKPGGGKGRLALDWWLRSESPAQLVGLADLSSNSAWLFEHSDFAEAAQQKPEGRLHFYIYTDKDYRPKRDRCHVRDFDAHRVEAIAPILFGIEARQ